MSSPSSLEPGEGRPGVRGSHTEWLRLREDSVPFGPSLKWQREQLLRAGVSEGHELHMKGEQPELTQLLVPPPASPQVCPERQNSRSPSWWRWKWATRPF